VPSTALENCAASGAEPKQTITSREKKRRGIRWHPSDSILGVVYEVVSAVKALSCKCSIACINTAYILE